MGAEDLDNNGKKELVLSGKYQSGVNDLLIFQWNNDMLELESNGLFPGLTEGDLQIFDINNDGLRDVYLQRFKCLQHSRKHHFK